MAVECVIGCKYKKGIFVVGKSLLLVYNGIQFEL